MIEVERKRLYFRKTFAIAYESVDYVDVLFVRLTGKDGKVSYGTCSPDYEVTGETVDYAYEILSRIEDGFFDADLSEVNYYHKKIQRSFSAPSVQHALEEAIINQDKDYYNRLGEIEKKPIMTTIGINNPEDTIKEAKDWVDRGFSIIKLKIGRDADDDIGLIRSVRDCLPESIGLALDANHAYNVKEAVKIFKAIADKNILFIEQPLPKDLDANIPELQELIPFPIIADESIIGLSDVKRIIKRRLFRGINIKLMKCGGPLNFLKIFELAKRNNLIVMIGCMYESNLSIATGANLALRLPIDYIDLDSGSIDFDEDRFKDASVKDGKIFIRGHALQKA